MKARHEETARGYTQIGLARALGISHGPVSYWTRGLRVPTAESCAKIALVLGITPQEVMAAAGHLPDMEQGQRGELLDMVGWIPSHPVFGQGEG